MRYPLNRILNSYSFRIALTYVMFFLVSTFILFVFIYYTDTRSVNDQLERALTEDKTDFSERFAQSGLNGLIRLVNLRTQSQSDNAAYSLINAERQIVAGNLAQWPSETIQTADTKDHQISFKYSLDPSRLYTYHGEIIELPEDYRLLVSRSDQPLIHAQRKLIQTFSWAALITLVLGLLGGYLMSTRAVRRIASINRLCRTIIDGDISQRLSINQAEDDLDELSLNINSMLDKIESLMQGIVQVSDNIAHDMRTPLSHLRLELESLQNESQLDASTKNRLTEAVQSTDKIIDTFNALLRISKMQAKHRPLESEVLALNPLLDDIIEFYAPIFEQRHQTLAYRANSKLSVKGDKNLLFQAIANLLDNATKYAPENSEISISLNQEDRAISLKICNAGDNISDLSIEKLSQRFFRLDAARSLPGSGLGLSLVEAIVNQHQAELILQNPVDGGLCAIIKFPLTSTLSRLN